MKYLFIAIFMILFVIFFVWQNIEVMKIKMENKRAVKIEEEIIKQNDRLIYEIEKFKRMDVIEIYAARRGMRPLAPGDFAVLSIGDNKK